MCHQVNTIAKNCCGQLSFCEGCQSYRLLFNNICIDFTEKELFAFQKYIKTISVDYWECKYDRMDVKRKVQIQTLQQNLLLIFNKQEFSLLRDLILKNTKKPFSKLSVFDVDYIFFLN